MDLISILATVILATTIGTVVIGIAAYAAFKLRDKRKPKTSRKDLTLDNTFQTKSIFLTPYVPEPSRVVDPEKK